MTLSACVATKYQMTGKDAPGPTLLELTASNPPLDLALRTTIVYNGPGSWKNDALWDEYVVQIRNRGENTVTLTGAVLADFAGAGVLPGDDPWVLEKESQTLEQRYERAGVAFARGSIPHGLIAGASAVTATSGGIVAGSVATVAAASVIALPVYYVVVWRVNHTNKAAVNSEFTRRRLALPVTLAAGELRTGSLFFPMTPSPQSLTLRWSDGPAAGEVALALQPLQGLHEIASVPNGANESRRTP